MRFLYYNLVITVRPGPPVIAKKLRQAKTWSLGAVVEKMVGGGKSQLPNVNFFV